MQSYLIAHFRRDQFPDAAQVLTEFFGLSADKCLTGSAHYFILDPIEAIHSAKTMTTVYHTSPKIITEIKPYELFDDCLFFAEEPYVMSAAAEVVVYKFELGEVVEASSLFYRDDCHKVDGIVADVIDALGCDEETAQGILDGSISSFDLDGFETDAETNWKMQALAGKCATALGVDAIEATDEQGTVWIVPMTGKLDRLELTDFEL